MYPPDTDPLTAEKKAVSLHFLLEKQQNTVIVTSYSERTITDAERTAAFMITKAHYDSKQFILDPVYSIHGKNPEDPVLPDAPYWHYGHYECEAFLLKKMIREKNEAKLKVGYTKNLLQPQGDAAFSLSSDVAGTIEFRASGSVRATLNGKEIYADGADDPAKKHILSLPEPGKLVIHLHVDDPEQTIPALLPLNVVDGWQYNGTEPVRRPQNSNGIPPHLAERPQISLNVVPVTENIWDAGVELLAYVDIESSTEPELFIGESIPEVENVRTSWTEVEYRSCAVEAACISKRPPAATPCRKYRLTRS